MDIHISQVENNGRSCQVPVDRLSGQRNKTTPTSPTDLERHSEKQQLPRKIKGGFQIINHSHFNIVNTFYIILLCRVYSYKPVSIPSL